METTQVDIITTLRAELVNDFEFTPRSSNLNLSHPYRSDYEATVNVKVGNAVKPVKVAIKSEHFGSTGTWGEPDYVESYYVYTPGFARYFEDPFKELTDIGIAVDYSEVFENFEIAVGIAKDVEKEIEKEKQRIAHENRVKEWETGWANEFLNKIDNDPNKRIRNTSFEMSIIDKDDFVEKGQSMYVKVAYKNYTLLFFKTDDRITFNLGNARNSQGTQINSLYNNPHTTKKSKNPGTILLKAFDELDHYVASTIAKKTRLEKEKEEREEKAKRLSELCGFPVHILEETKYPQGRNGRKEWEKPYLIYSYYVKFVDSEGCEDGVRKVGVSENVHKRWNSEKNENEILGTIYTVGTFGYLSLEQFKAILNVLNPSK